MTLVDGQPAPLFTAPTLANPRFAFGSIGGRYVLLGFLPLGEAGRRSVLSELEAHRPALTDAHVTCFLVCRDPGPISEATDGPGLRWFFDRDGTVSRLYRAASETGDESPKWVLVDPSLRILHQRPIRDTADVFRTLAALPPVDEHAGTRLHAPVLVVPRIFEPAVCRALIDFYERAGGSPSGVMREVNGRTVGVLDDFKKRRDASIEDEPLQRDLRARIVRRLLPEIEKAFQFRPTRLERYIVARYDATEGGYFRPHRDNTTAGTAHRKFAVSINLNAEQYEGGDLRFPEFGTRTYRPPTGGAVVFSCSLLHEATPVTRGQRFAFLPFLYDEPGEQLRQKNLHLLQLGPSPGHSSADPASAA